MKEITLHNGMVTIVDDDDFESLSKFYWRAHASKWRSGIIWYAATRIQKNYSRKRILMHRMITNPLSDTMVDHFDGNGLNNQRFNLRFCTNAQNQQNCKKHKGTSSQYKGVVWNKKLNKWRARIVVNKAKKHLGYFHCESDAARAYDMAAVRYFGEFALPNFLQPVQGPLVPKP